MAPERFGGKREVEIKLAAPDLGAVRRRALRLGFRPLTRRLLERNQVFDTPNRALREAGQLLRLRSKGRQNWLTWKGNAEPESRHKTRAEIETEVRDAKRLASILRLLGFQPVFEYEKYRTELGRPGEKGKILLDETPIGNFIELEGPPPWIDRVARQLGYGPQDYIQASYGMLYMNWHRSRGIQPGRMVFRRKKALRGSSA